MAKYIKGGNGRGWGIPKSAPPDEKAARSLVFSAQPGACRQRLRVVQSKLLAYIAPQPLELSVREVGDVLTNSGVPAEKVEAFQEGCRRQYGEDAALKAKNIIDSGKFQITTPEVKITVPPEYSYMVEARVIDGRKYILIPADEGVEINGIGVNIPNLQRAEDRTLLSSEKWQALSYLPFFQD